MPEASGALAAETGSRWDPLVRITHWGVAAAVLLNGLVTDEGGQVHVWIGYAAFAMLALRLVWGLVGTEEARFSAFPISLSAARTHVADMLAGRHRTHRSHNPIGALMAYALWATLAVVVATGIAMSGSPFSPRPVEDEAAVERQLAPAGEDERDEYGEAREEHEEDEEGEEGEEGEEVLEEVHEVAANLLLVLAALHVGGVGLESWLSGRNLPREMVTGERAASGR